MLSERYGRRIQLADQTKSPKARPSIIAFQRHQQIVVA